MAAHVRESPRILPRAPRLARRRTGEPRRRPSGVLLRTGLVLSAAGAVAVTGCPTAWAGPQHPEPASRPDPGRTLITETGDAADLIAGPIKDLQLHPLAGTGVDPLDNSLGAQVADFRPVSTGAATGPLADGASLDELPVLGAAAGLLPG